MLFVQITWFIYLAPEGLRDIGITYTVCVCVCVCVVSGKCYKVFEWTILLSSAMNMATESFYLEEWGLEIGTTQFFKNISFNVFPAFWTLEGWRWILCSFFCFFFKCFPAFWTFYHELKLSLCQCYCFFNGLFAVFSHEYGYRIIYNGWMEVGE